MKLPQPQQMPAASGSKPWEDANVERKKVRIPYEFVFSDCPVRNQMMFLMPPPSEPETPNGSSAYSGLKSLSTKSKHELFSQVVAPRALECSRHIVPFVIVPMALRMSFPT